MQPFDHVVGDFVFETTVRNHDALSAGVLFGLGDSIFGGGLSVILDYKHNEVLITTARNFQIYDARTFRFEKDSYRLRVFAHHKTVEVYLDDCLILHHLMNRPCGRVALMVESGSASFGDIRLHAVRPFDHQE